MNLTKEQLEAWITGSLNYSGVIYSNPDASRALLVYRQVLGNGFYHLPFFLVADLFWLLSQGYEVRFQSERDRNPQTEGSNFDRKLIVRYERECLGRLLQSSDVNAAIEIAATSPAPEKVTIRLLFQILKTLGPHYPEGYLLNPGLLRDYQFSNTTNPADFESFGFDSSIETFLGNLNSHVNWNELLFEEDVFELSHLDTLGTDHLRVGCRQILSVSRLLRSHDLPDLDLSSHEDGADTAFLDETHYPAGGLAGLTNRGSFENLLTSELVYIDEGIEGVSLFDLRFAEGELLFYLRDSGYLRRKRRAIHFILDVGDIFESKLPGYQWQYSVLLQGICLRLLHDLFSVFEMDALRFHFHYIESEAASKEEKEFFEGEIGVMKTALSDYVKHEWVTFQTQDEVGLESLIDPKRKTYAVVFAGGATIKNWQSNIAHIKEEKLALHCALISVDTKDEHGSLIELPRSGLPVDEIAKKRNLVLKCLVS